MGTNAKYMDRDKLILVSLSLILVFLVFAFVGILGLTGYLIFFTGDKKEKNEVVPIYNAQINIEDEQGTTTEEKNEEEQSQSEETTKSVQTAPVCGNKVKESGEECEIDSDCGTDKVCKSCKCEPKPIEEPKIPKLTNLKVEELIFFCPPEFEGKKGLGLKIIRIKNTSQTDFSYLKQITINAEINDVIDSVKTNNAYKFSARIGETTSIYPKDILRASAPFIFLGNKPGRLKLTLTFGTVGYIEHDYDLRAMDFAQAGCL